MADAPVTLQAAAPAAASAPQAPEPALLQAETEAEESLDTEAAVQAKPESAPVAPTTLESSVAESVAQPTPAPSELSRLSAPNGAAVQDDEGLTAATPAAEALTVPFETESPTTPGEEQLASPLAPSAPRREAPDDDGLSLPLWQMEVAVGAVALALALVALWTVLRRRSVSQI